MKTHGRLFERIVTFENLLRAALRARLGKRTRPDVASFEFRLERELLTLQTELRNLTYRPGSYRQFRIIDPKPCLISSPPFRDRVVHHALCQVIEPLFERSFIEHTYACRVDKGTHRALDRFQLLARGHKWALTCDISKFFASIDHELLVEALKRKIRDRECLWLIEQIVDSSPPQDSLEMYFGGDDLLTPLERHRGLPIGNLTSQLFANVYLNPLDHFVTRELRCPEYLRYCDDFVLFSNSYDRLTDWRNKIGYFLDGIRLRLHPAKSVILQTAHGIRFLGFRVDPTRRKLDRGNVIRFKRRLRRLQNMYANGYVDLPRVGASVQAWIAHASHGDTAALRTAVLNQFVFQRSSNYRLGGGSKTRRLVRQ